MPNHLIYHFEPEQLTRDRLIRIIDDYFELIEFKPEMDNFLRNLGIKYENRTKLMLR